MSNSVELEEFLLCENQEEFIKKQILGTNNYYFYKFLHLFQNCNGKLNDTEKKEIIEYNQKFHTENSRYIYKRYLLFEIENEKDEPKRKQLFEKLNSTYLNYQFSYNQPPQTHGTTGIKASPTEDQEQQHQLGSNYLDFQRVIEKSYTDLNVMRKIKQIGYSYVNVEKLIQTGKKECIDHFMKTYPLSEYNEAPQLISKYFSFLRKDKKSILNVVNYQKLTLIQMKELAQIEPELLKENNFVNALMLKEFPCNLEDLAQENWIECKKLMQTIITWVEKLEQKFQYIKDILIFQILAIGLENKSYDFDIFMKYLEQPMKMISNYNKEYEQISQKYLKQYDNFFYNSFVNFCKIQPTELIEKYLIQHFKQHDKIQPFDKYLKNKFLENLLNKTRLYVGKEVPDLANYFSSNEIDQMQTEKLLTICKYNKSSFKTNEEVSVDLEIKNISEVEVKVYEIETENYLIQFQQEIDGQLNLEGLIASEQTKFVFNQPCTVKHIEQFKFEKIQKQLQGIFIIEFIGGGLLSRAVVKKGSLMLLDKVALTGQKFTILDQDLEICKGSKEKRIGMWIEKQWYQANENGEIAIPFAPNQKTYNVILVNDQFACLKKGVEIKAEKFEFLCNYIYNEETFILGNKAKIVVQPKLFVNNIPASLKIIERPQILVTLINEQDVPITTAFEEIAFDEQMDNEIEVQVQAKIKRVLIDVSGRVKTMNSKDEYVNLHESHVSNINNEDLTSNLCTQLLKINKKKEYEIYLVGKTGEKKGNIQMEISFIHKLYQFNEKAKLTTNAEGIINLGQLQNVELITSRILGGRGNISGEEKQWKICQESQTCIPKTIKILENEILKLLFFGGELNKHTVSLNQFANYSTDNIQANLLQQLTINGNFLQLPPLKAGLYTLQLFNQNEVIQINVLKGKYWNNTQLLVSPSQLIDMSIVMSILMINSVDIKQNQEGKFSIKIQIYSNFPKTTKVHILASQFQPQNINLQCEKSKTLLKKDQSKNYDIPDILNEFYSNKQLSSEQNYVNSRKNQERFIGNNLERPQVLLKRIEIRETSFEQEQLIDETEFRSKDKKMKKEKKCYEQDFNGGYGGRQSAKYNQEKLNSIYNFLQKSSTIIANRKLNEEGLIEIDDVDLKGYSNLLVLVSNYGQVISQNIQINDSSELQVRDLREKLSSEDKLIVPQFKSVCLKEGSEWATDDLNSTEFKIIDSISKLYNLQVELRKLKGSDVENEKGYSMWKFLTKWNALTLEEKHENYEQYSSHEINLFIKFKDPAYFEIFVKSFLENKFEKTFVDYFLLEDKEQLLVFNNPKKMRKLNYMERVLLIMFLKRNGMIDDAKEIYNSIVNENKLKPQNQKQIKQLYETILSIKEKEKESLPQKMQQNKLERMAYEMEQTKMMMANIDLCCCESAPQMLQEAKCFSKSRMNKKTFQLCQEEVLESEEMEEERGNLAGKKQFVAEFKQVEKTKEYAERQYFGQKQFRKNDFYNKVENNAFWEDLAKFAIENDNLKSFLSTNFIFCNTNHTEMLACLTFLSLPFKETSHQFGQFKEKGLNIKVAGNSVVFSREMKECKSEIKSNLLIAQRFFDPANRFEEQEDEPGVKQEKEATEFLIDTIYGCQVVMTNLSNSSREIQLIAHLPEGTLPVQSSNYTHSQLYNLSPYSSSTCEYLFYFPKEGKFSLLPATISKNNLVIAVAQKKEFIVYPETQIKKLETMDQILAQGSIEDILNFASTKNIQNPNVFNFKNIYYLLKNADFYSKFISILKKRKIFNKIVWQFSVFHGDYSTFKDFQMNKTKKFLEYHPIVNQRIHMLHKSKSNILNVEFKKQYETFLKHLVTQYEPVSDTQKLCLIYYLLLQERISEAIKLFQQIKVKQLMPQKLQYDYFAAYLDFYIGYPNFQVAREICEQYLNYPELYWRNLFYNMANQIAEYDGDVPIKQQELKSAAQKNEQGASKEEIFEAVLEKKNMEITHQNVSKITISFYIIDLETLFSRDPFFLQGKQDYSFIKPIQKIEKLLQLNIKETSKVMIEIPQALQSQNVFIQLRSSNKICSLTYFSSLLNVHIIENYGQLKVMDSQQNPLPKVYVKSFAQHQDGKSMFYKDGYTDLRGKFDYASASSQNIKQIKKFSFFIMSDHFGSLIKEAQPPSQLGRFEEKIILSTEKWNLKAKELEEQKKQKYQELEKQFQ